MRIERLRFGNEEEYRNKIWEYIEHCERLLERLNIQTTMVSDVFVLDDIEDCWGLCHEIEKGKEYQISINISLIDLAFQNIAIFGKETFQCKALIETIMHELLHTIRGCFDHGKKWHYFVNKVNQAYKLDIKVADTFFEKDVRKEVYFAGYNYILECSNCHLDWRYKTRCKRYREYENYRCPNCGSKIIQIV